MFTVICIMFGGITVGYLLRKKPLTQVNRIITILIWALLFLLGVEVGDNPQVIGSITTLGIEALIISLLSTLGSCIAAWALWTTINRRNKQGGQQ